MTQNQSPTRSDAPEQDKPKAEPQQPTPIQSPPGKVEPQGKPQNQS